MVFVDVVVCIAFGLGLMGMCAAGWLFEVVAVVNGWMHIRIPCTVNELLLSFGHVRAVSTNI